MSTIKSFPPIANKDANLLILGSIPGIASLNAQQYYAHPRNSFWHIMANIYGFDSNSAYELRVKYLLLNRVAVWDVLQSCVRQGSLDTSIVSDSKVPNDFADFFQNYPNIKTIGLNGAEAEKSFKRFVSNIIDLRNFKIIKLPSTSPANTQSIQFKMESWKKLIQ